MATKENTIIIEIGKALNAVSDPDLHVRDPLGTDLAKARENDVFILPTDMGPPSGIGASRREHLNVTIMCRAKLVSPDASNCSYRKLFEVSNVIRDALKNWPDLQGGGDAGVEQVRRLNTQLFCEPFGAVGQPAAVLVEVVVDWTE